jgi:serine protease Do
MMLRIARAVMWFGLAMLAALGPAQAESCKLDAAQVYEKAAPGVVRIFTFAVDPFDPYEKVRFSIGTGFIIDDQGTILTNYHVVLDSVRISLGFASGETAQGEFLAGDPVLDIALLRPAYYPEHYGKLEFAEDAPPRLGTPVFAIGNPMGLKTSISSGIISSTGVVLPISNLSWDEPFIQTDAPINPGNSGGPLLDDCGRVRGMNTLVLPRGEDMGFAIPVATLKTAAKLLLRDKRIIRPWIGISGRMTDEFVMSLVLVPFSEGFMVETVEPGSAADKAGLRGGSFPLRIGPQNYLLGGDIITEVNGKRVTDLGVTANIVRALKPGDEIELTYVRDGEEQHLKTKLFERPVLPQDERALYRIIYGLPMANGANPEP